MYTSYSESEARISCVPVKAMNLINTILVACVVAVASSIIGSLLVSSLLVIPVASSLQLCKSYKFTMLSSIIISLICGVSGLCISYPLSINTGGTIVLMATAILILSIIYKLILKKLFKSRALERSKSA